MNLQPAKLKLIYIVTQPEWGGAQRYIFDLATTLKDEFDILVAAGVGGSQELLQKCQEAGIRTHIFKNLVREINPKKDVTAIAELTKFFKQEKPDIVHLNSSKAGVIGALAARRFQISDFRFQIVYTAHGWIFNEPLSWWKKRFYMLLERAACKIHDKVIVLSKADFDVALKNKVCAPEKMIIIPHGIKLINFLDHEAARQYLKSSISNLSAKDGSARRGKSEIGNLKSEIWIGTIANLYKTKGLEYLIEAAKLLKRNGAEPTFLVIGNGPMEKIYKLQVPISSRILGKAGTTSPDYIEDSRQSRNYKLNNFFFIGSIPDAARYLMAFDIFVLPSAKEGLPYALLEAGQAGLPIIATCVGAIPEMIENEKNGLLVKPKDLKMLREAIEKLLNDEGLRNKLGEEAQKTFKEKFDFDAMIQKTLKVYTTDSREI